jgi:predicted Zn-dependent protease
LLIEKRVAESPWRDAPSDPALALLVNRIQAKLDGFLDRPERLLSALPDSDRDEFTLMRRAVALHRLPDPKAALATVEALMTLRPKDAYIVELRAQFLLEGGRAAEAVAAYRQAVTLAPRESLIRASLARALLSLGEAERDREALALLEAAAKDDPGNAGALRDLAIAYARTGREGLAALATAERYALTADFRDALINARRAAGLLPEGTPGWLRAQDIILVGERLTKKN